MMIRSSFPLFFLTIFLSLFLTARSEGRAPHGIAQQSPQAFSPAAYDFFHPDSHQQQHHPDQDTSSRAHSPNQDASRAHSPIPLAAQVKAGEESSQHEGQRHLSTPRGDKTRVGPGTAVVIVFGFVFVVLLAMGAYYVVATRHANSDRAKNAAQASYV